MAAFTAFTLPSVLLMFGFAALAPQLGPGLGAARISAAWVALWCVAASMTAYWAS